MFAIVEIAGKQFKVSKGDVLDVPRMKEHEVGAKVKMDKVLLTSDGKSATLGMPLVEGAMVELMIKEHGKADKIRVYRKQPKKRMEKAFGHRQPYTKVEVVSVK